MNVYFSYFYLESQSNCGYETNELVLKGTVTAIFAKVPKYFCKETVLKLLALATQRRKY